MIEKNKILKLVIFAIVALYACMSVSADTSNFISGYPDGGESAEMNVGFSYDPEKMQRFTFGFTDSDNIDWFGTDGNTKLNLGTQVMQGRGELARGRGNINFYWILRTDKAVTAKLYLQAPLLEVNSSESLDWSISFDSQINGITNHGLKIDSVYGVGNALPIFAKSGVPSQNILIGYQPIEVSTEYAPVKIETQSYVGTVGVVVETN